MPLPRRLVDRLGVEVVLDVARQRAGEDDELGVLRQVASFSSSVSSSSGAHRGPHSLISVNVPPVGSTTAVEVRDSPSMRTKSLRIASCVERLDDPRAGLAADEAGRDDRHAERSSARARR